MKIHNVAQQSVEWMNLRAGIPTASEMGNLVSPKGKVRDGEMPTTYLAEKVAEWWLGGPLASANVFDMEIGQVLETEARPWYALTFDKEVRTVGFITTDDGKVGCSPDGLLADDTGLEIKCPKAETHTGYLLKGVLPDAYVLQVQASMWVTGAKQWTFLSYRRRFPALVLAVERDEDIQEAISEALAAFLAKFESATARLVELNGGPPKRYIPPAQRDIKDPDEVGIVP